MNNDLGDCTILTNVQTVRAPIVDSLNERPSFISDYNFPFENRVPRSLLSPIRLGWSESETNVRVLHASFFIALVNGLIKPVMNARPRF